MWENKTLALSSWLNPLCAIKMHQMNYRCVSSLVLSLFLSIYLSHWNNGIRRCWTAGLAFVTLRPNLRSNVRLLNGCFISVNNGIRQQIRQWFDPMHQMSCEHTSMLSHSIITKISFYATHCLQSTKIQYFFSLAQSEAFLWNYFLWNKQFFFCDKKSVISFHFWFIRKNMWVNSDSLIKLFAINALFIFNVFANLNDYEITCKDEKGQNVDWYLFDLFGEFKNVTLLLKIVLFL